MPENLTLADNNTTVYQTDTMTTKPNDGTPSRQQMPGHVTSQAQPIGKQMPDHVTQNPNDEPIRTRNIRTDQNPDEGGHFEGQYQPDATHER